MNSTAYTLAILTNPIENMKNIFSRLTAWATTNYKRGFLGKLKVYSAAILALFLFITPFALVEEAGRTSVEINSGIVTVRKQVSSGDSATSIAEDISERLYRLANNNPNAKQVVFLLKMDKQGVVDKYGNSKADDIDMGNIDWNERTLDEARKYKDSYKFKQSGVKTATIITLKSMPGGHLLIE